jgi:hypothetical protein
MPHLRYGCPVFALTALALAACGSGNGDRNDAPATKSQLRPLIWTNYQGATGSRKLKIRYRTNLSSPLDKVEVRESDTTVVVRLLKKVVFRRDREGNYYSDQTSDERLPCVLVVLARPLNGRRVLRAGEGVTPPRPGKETVIKEPCTRPPEVESQ